MEGSRLLGVARRQSAPWGTSVSRVALEQRRVRSALRGGDLALLAVLAVVVRLVMAWAIPLASGTPDPNCAPDELEHFLVVRELAAGRVPTWPELPSIYAALLPVPYLPHAALLAAGREYCSLAALYRARPVWPELQGYPFARLGSVLAGVVTVVALARPPPEPPARVEPASSQGSWSRSFRSWCS